MTDASSSSTPPAGRRPRAIVRFAVVMIVLLAADLATKHVAFARVAGGPVAVARDADGGLAPIPAHRPVPVMPGLALRLTLNEGAVFGLGEGWRWLFVVFSVVAALVIVVVFARSPRGAVTLHIALAAVLAGAIGNLYDRIEYGVVRDFLWLFPTVRLPFGWHWPGGGDGLYPWIFNVADVCLVVGLAVLMIIMYRHDRRLARAEAAGRAGA